MSVSAEPGEGPPALARPAIADVRGQRRMQHLYRLHAEGLDAVEDSLAGTEQDRGDVERELVDDPGDKRLPHGPGAPRDVHAVIAGGLARLRVGDVEPAGDEVEGRPAVHLDRLASVMGEHEHRSVVRRLRSPPPAPVLLPLTADRPEHVSTHQVRATRTHEPAGRRLVGLVGALVAQVPAVQLPSALAQRVLATLLWPGDEAVERDRHVARGVLHQHPPEWLRQANAKTSRKGHPSKAVRSMGDPGLEPGTSSLSGGPPPRARSGKPRRVQAVAGPPPPCWSRKPRG